MPDLPATGVVTKSTFFHVEIDLFGPIIVKCATGSQKRGVTLFTCLLSLAVYLEMTMGLSAHSFLHPFRILVATRGKPRTTISDNAINLKLTANALQGMFQKVNDAKNSLEVYNLKSNLE